MRDPQLIQRRPDRLVVKVGGAKQGQPAASAQQTAALFPELLIRYASRILDIGDFFSQAAAGTLPAFSLVEPDYLTASEENPQNIPRGEQFAAKVINAVMSGPGWGSTLLVWTFDERVATTITS